MEFKVDVDRFIEETSLPKNVVDRIKLKREMLSKRKGIYSVNDSLGKEIASAVFGDLVSAHFRRWMLATYEIGDEE